MNEAEPQFDARSSLPDCVRECIAKLLGFTPESYTLAALEGRRAVVACLADAALPCGGELLAADHDPPLWLVELTVDRAIELLRNEQVALIINNDMPECRPC